MSKSPTARFSDRVENYVRYRPGYPPEVLDLLRTECGLQPHHIVADIASGTGVFTRLPLENGNSVFAVEPNTEMREMGAHQLESYSRLVSIAGTAEETTLRSGSVDFVAAAQAAHWFDLPRARAEFARILRPGGWCVLIWNERRTASTPFLRDYEQLLLTYGTDYKEVRHERTTAIIHEFFAPAPHRERAFDLRQQFDYEGTAGRLLSSSYAPLEGHPSHAPMMQELQRIFRAHATDNAVEFEYNTRVFYGHL
ncbi:MAG TPA: class I SAM-dependent methyltransferase [Terriglobales bacterium]|jgi:SAM-dependent methyltransferase|nr:class I SAM-dependent methyltransferase [Terriglobales bacterium]